MIMPLLPVVRHASCEQPFLAQDDRMMIHRNIPLPLHYCDHRNPIWGYRYTTSRHSWGKFRLSIDTGTGTLPVHTFSLKQTQLGQVSTVHRYPTHFLIEADIIGTASPHQP